MGYVWVGDFITAPLKTGGLPDIFEYYTPNPLQGPGYLRVRLTISK